MARMAISKPRIRVDAVDPRLVPALMAGGIWIPGMGVNSIGGGHFTWDSQATQANQLTTANNFEVPTQATASNGVAIWNMNPITYAQGFGILSPGTALKFASLGSYAFWMKERTDDTTICYMLEMWPNTADKRFYVYKNNTVGKMSINGSFLGQGDADPTDRWKANIRNIDFASWNFYRFTFDYSLDNYQVSGANFSNKMRVYINETLITEVNGGGAYHEGYSAPPFPYSEPPDGPIMGTGLYTGGTRFFVGANGGSSGWSGWLGPVYAANGTEGLDDTVWAKVMKFHAPA